jgi:sugar/nucleoside kinase (ribokinase family)
MNSPTSNKKYDVYGVGNALVDILANVEESFIGQFGLHHGSMALMDAKTQGQVLEHLEMKDLKLACGGSAANTMVAIAQSGGSGIYAGKVAHDTYGEFYQQDMQKTGIAFPVKLATEQGLPTGTCVVLTTPDAERTMCTHLGISTSLHASEIQRDQIAKCKISYVEGYLWDADQPRAACRKTFELSNELGVKTAFTFSDAFLVDRFPNEFREVVTNHCDIVFCNADEARRFCKKESLDECAAELGQLCELVFITDGSQGCLVVEKGKSTLVKGFAVKAVDTVGAGDAFAGGVLYGLTHDHSPQESARWGNRLASEVVATYGPRLPAEALADLERVLN